MRYFKKRRPPSRRPVAKRRAYYYAYGGWSWFEVSPEKFLIWNDYCRNLGHKPGRDDYIKFKQLAS